MKTVLDRPWFRTAPLPATTSHTLSTTENKALIEEYLACKATYAPAAVRSYRVWIERFQNSVSKQPENTTVGDFTAFAATLKKHTPKGIEYALNVVHNYLRFFAEQGRLRLPMYLIRVPKAVSRSHRAVEEAEYRKMLSVLSSRLRSETQIRDTLLLMLLHDTGMRIGEMLSLRLSDIDAKEYSAVIVSDTIFHK